MQLFPCPFCGTRNESEFYFAGEAGKLRPDTTGEVGAPQWSQYMYAQRNDKGPAREIWLHRPCSEMFMMERDSLTMAVLGVTRLRKEEA